MNVLDRTVSDRFSLYPRRTGGRCLRLPRAQRKTTRSSKLPFASLYTYSNSPRDMGQRQERRSSSLTSASRRGDGPRHAHGSPCPFTACSCRRARSVMVHRAARLSRRPLSARFKTHGFIYHRGRDLDPVTAMQRTRRARPSVQDRARERLHEPPGHPRLRRHHAGTPGDPENRVKHDNDSCPSRFGRSTHRPCGWTSTVRHLQHRSAREHDDSGTSARCSLRSSGVACGFGPTRRRGDVAHTGIGSEGYVALQEGRLSAPSSKTSYYQQAAHWPRLAAAPDTPVCGQHRRGTIRP